MADAKLIVKRLIEEPWKGNWDVIDEHAAPGYVGHDSAEPEPHRGPAGLRANVEKYIAGFPGGAITVDDQIAEGDKVATRWTGRGTQTGEVAGIAPTGKEVTVSGLTMTVFKSDDATSSWTATISTGTATVYGVAPGLV